MIEDLRDEEEKLSIYIGVARVIYRLIGGDGLTTNEVADLMRRHRTTAYRFLVKLEACHYVPIYFNMDTGLWEILRREERHEEHSQDQEDTESSGSLSTGPGYSK